MCYRQLPLLQVDMHTLYIGHSNDTIISHCTYIIIIFQPSPCIGNIYDGTMLWLEIMEEIIEEGGDPRDGALYTEKARNRKVSGNTMLLYYSNSVVLVSLVVKMGNSVQCLPEGLGFNPRAGRSMWYGVQGLSLTTH